MRLPRIPPKRKTLQQKLRDIDVTVVAAESKQMDAADATAVGFRDLASTAQDCQDDYLGHYQSSIKACYIQGVDTVESKVLHAVCFPTDFDAFYNRPRRFFNPVMTRYSHRLHSSIPYGTFTRYRNLLIWWANTRYNERNAAPPLTARLSMGSRRWPNAPSVEQASDSDDQATRHQSHLGLAELHQLAPSPNMIPESLFFYT